jgi:hypothetical protein
MFRQSVPLSGYKWKATLVAWGGKMSTGPPVLSWDRASYTREYDPLADEPALFLTLAETKGDADSILTFVNEYGMLDVAPERSVPHSAAAGVTNALVDYQRAIGWLRQMVGIWRHATAGDVESLRRHISWEHGRLVLRGLLDWDRQPVTEAGPAVGTDEWHRRYSESIHSDLHSGDIAQGDVVGVAYSLLAREITLQLGGAMPSLFYLAAERRAVFSFGIYTLWGALMLQFAQAIASQHDYRHCAVCTRWFMVAPGFNRSNRTTCSDTCRQKLYKQRRERALALHGEGKQPREIARELGSDVKTVRGWIERAKEQ